MKNKIFIILSVVVMWNCGQKAAIDTKKPNVLFIAVDDLRPELNCYGASHIKSPNIDKLASTSTIFQNAYCQQAVCAPSRNSLMTGLRPDAIGIYDLYTFFRTKVPDVVTLPQHFKDNGYYTERIGKIYHLGHGNSEDSLSWSQPAAKLWRPEPISRGDTVGLERDYPTIDGKKLPYYKSKAPEKNMSDVVSTDYAVQRIAELKDTTFFFAVGFSKPHLPFVAPASYWDMYDTAEIEIPERKEPEGMPSLALHHFGELRKYYDIPSEGLLNDETSRNLIHGYYAAVSMVDAQIGKLMKALEDNGLLEKTIVVLWGDHGWKLGDYGGWCKHTNFELDTRVPLIIHDPRNPIGQKSTSLSEFVDIYPTICELAGLPSPSHLEGTSLVPVLQNPAASVKDMAISQYPRGKSLGYDRKNEIMGYSMRYQQYRFTRWQKYENPKEIVAIELYDHSKGPLAIENLAEKPEFKELAEELSIMLTNELAKYKLKKPTSS
jgi:iduronate 2-sulfatase